MRSILILVLVGLGCTGPLRSPAADVPPPVLDDGPLAACAGRWIHRGPQTILGRSVDRVMEIARGEDGWTLSFVTVLHPGLRPKHAEEVNSRRMDERSPLAVEGDRFVYRTVLYADGLLHEVRDTFRLDGERLFFPAWVRRGDREWAFAGAREDIVIRTEHDPRLVAAGSATITGFPLQPKPITYAAAREPDAGRTGVEQFVIRFAQPDKNGAMEDLGRLVENPEWGRAYMHFNTVLEPAWTRLTDEEWASIVALPAWAGPAR